jgi:HK97 family phage major capsid protein
MARTFKHSAEAQQHLNALHAERDYAATRMHELRRESDEKHTSIERRDDIISELREHDARLDELEREIAEAEEARQELHDKENSQQSLAANLTSERIAARNAYRDADPTGSHEYELAWCRAIVTGDQSGARALVNTSGLGVLTPKRIVDAIGDILKSGGKIASWCNRTNIKGQSIWPVADSYTDPALHNETGTDAKVEKEITMSSVTMEPQFIAEILRTTRKFEADSIEAFWTWIRMELPDALYRVIDRNILLGGQGDKDGIHGILTNTTPRFVATLSAPTMGFSTPHFAIAELGEGVNEVVFVMNRKTFYNTYLNLVDASGRPIYQVLTQNDGKVLELFGGHRVVFTSALPSYDDAVAGQAYIVAGDFKGFVLNFPLGQNVRLLRDEFTEMSKNVIRYLSEIYVAGNIVRPECFVKVMK